METKYYTGIGSRETPLDIQNFMHDIALALAADNYILRSGGAEGADSAFESGASAARIYLPWSPFNGKSTDGIRYVVPPFRYDLVEEYHPAPERLGYAAQKLMSRNTYQIMGDDLATFSEFVICWTSDGRASGGTGQALRIAASLHIPIFNLYSKTDKENIKKKLNI